jgi:hypothetical protein
MFVINSLHIKMRFSEKLFHDSIYNQYGFLKQWFRQEIVLRSTICL